MENFKNIKHRKGLCFFKGKMIDTSVLNDEQAEELVERGFPYLTKVAKKRKTSK